jgi:hypothetical protein
VMAAFNCPDTDRCGSCAFGDLLRSSERWGEHCANSSLCRGGGSRYRTGA